LDELNKEKENKMKSLLRLMQRPWLYTARSIIRFFQNSKVRLMTGILLLIIGIAAGAFVAIYIMLYGGIMAILGNWGTNNSAVVWGFIRAIFFEIGGITIIPFWIAGFFVLSRKDVHRRSLSSNARKLQRISNEAWKGIWAKPPVHKD